MIRYKKKSPSANRMTLNKWYANTTHANILLRTLKSNSLINVRREKMDQSKNSKTTKEITIYIYMDDSGKLTKKEKVSVFAGIVLDKSEKEIFHRRYKSIITDIKCGYCAKNSHMCTHNDCPEVKSNNVTNKHKRRLINLCKQYHTYAVIIDNSRVYDSILSSKASKGRYTDYAQKRIIKKVIEKYIDTGKINPQDNLTLHINIDQQTTKSNGYYTLQESICEELHRGIINFDYSTFHKAIIFGELIVNVRYLDSKKVYGIQASDILAGKVRKTVINDFSDKIELSKKLDTFIDTKLWLP